MPSRMWTMARSDIDPIARPIIYRRTTIITIFFSVNDIDLIGILSEKAKLSSGYFKENIIKELHLTFILPGGDRTQLAYTYISIIHCPQCISDRTNNGRMRFRQTWSPSLFTGARTLWFLSFWLPARNNVQVRRRDSGKVGRDNQNDHRRHPEVPIDCSFSRMAKRVDEYIKNKRDYFE
jgi:hypothetical protein